MGGQFSGNGMTFCPHPIRRCGIETGAIETSSAMGGGFPAGRVFPRPVWRFESGSGAIGMLSEFGGRLSDQVSVFRAGGVLRGQVRGGRFAGIGMAVRPGCWVAAPGAVLRQRQRGQANRRPKSEAGCPAKFWLSAPAGSAGASVRRVFSTIGMAVRPR